MINRTNKTDNHLTITAVFFLLIALAMLARLFVLQILEHNYYSTFALSTHEIYKRLYPERGQIYFQDSRDGSTYPAAINRQYHLLYAVPTEIPTEQVSSTANALIDILQLKTPEEKDALTKKINKPNDPYEPLAKKLTDETIEKIKEKKLTGIYSTPQTFRYYPEEELGSNILGFCRVDELGQSGSYGIEGYWDKVLAGKGGFFSGQKGAFGNLITLTDNTKVEATDGPDIVLTIDRNLEYQACATLKEGWIGYEAKSASLVLMDPKTGAVLAMCSYPDFNPNKYSEIKDVAAYNNTNVFTPYEPGSVFKAITLAAGLDLDLFSPQTTFNDPCERKIDGFTIRNAEGKCYNTITMTQVLENSVNTGLIWAEEKIGRDRFIDYVKKFGFGEKTGTELNTEMGGNLATLEKNGKVYGAVASFGQGITVTPMQLAAAYSAIANEGNLPKAHIISELRWPDGKIEKTKIPEPTPVISPRAAKLITGMLVSVVEKGHSKQAGFKNYYIAGKTGTAQIPGPGGYTNETNHTFAGFGPVNNPKVVAIIKYEMPQRAWAESTATVTFKKIMDYVIKYYGLPEER